MATTGIINSALQPTGAVTLPQLDVQQDAKKTTAQLAPQNWNVTDEQTTSGQFNKITATDNPLMQMARSNAQAQANSRGLLNSTMAATAGEAAAYQAAVPLAQSNATTYADAAKTNAIAYNTAASKTNDQANALQTGAVQQGYTAGNLDKQFEFDLTKMDKAAVIALNQMTAQQQQDLAKMAVAQGYNLQTMTAQQINDLAKMKQAQDYNLQTLSTQYGFDLNKMDKQAAITLSQMSVQQQNDLAKMAKAQGYNLETLSVQQINDLAKMTLQQSFDLAKMDKQVAAQLSVMSEAQKNDLAKMAVANGYDLNKMTVQQLNDLQKMQVAQDNNLQTLAKQYGYDIAKMDQATANTLKTMSVEQQNRIATMAIQQGFDLQKMTEQQVNDLAKLDKSINGQTSIANIEAKYRQVIQASASATSMFNNSQNAINDIMKQNWPTDAKQKAIDSVNTNFANGMSLIAALSGDLDLEQFMQDLTGNAINTGTNTNTNTTTTNTGTNTNTNTNTTTNTGTNTTTTTNTNTGGTVSAEQKAAQISGLQSIWNSVGGVANPQNLSAMRAYAVAQKIPMETVAEAFGSPPDQYKAALAKNGVQFWGANGGPLSESEKTSNLQSIWRGLGGSMSPDNMQAVRNFAMANGVSMAAVASAFNTPYDTWLNGLDTFGIGRW